jgi:hypothetical protein
MPNSKIQSLITNNPYRILGVFANASKKDILSNVNKLKAFAKVGKSTEYPSDFITVLGNIERSVQTIDDATKNTERAIDCLKATLFWFVNSTQFDQIAFNHLYTGNIEKATQIWEKKESLSSLLNLSICALFNGDYFSVAQYVDRLIQVYGNDLCKIVDETLVLSASELIELYVDTLTSCDEQILNQLWIGYEHWPLIDFAKLHGKMKVTGELTNSITGDKFKSCAFVNANGDILLVGFSSKLGELTPSEISARKDELMVIKLADKNYKLVSSKGVKFTSKLWQDIVKGKIVNKLVCDVDAAITNSKAIKSEKPQERYKSGVSLQELSQKVLPALKKVVGESGVEFISISDKFAREILQCGIDYHNNTPEDEEIPEQALQLQEYALGIAVGTMVKTRCQENVDIMRDIVKKMPPATVRYYHRLLKARIDSFYDEPANISRVTKFIVDCAPYLMSIKTELGSTNEYYVRMSTRVAADALSDVISDYNEQSDKLHKRMESASSREKSNILEEFKTLVRNALIALYKLKSLDVDPEFKKNRFSTNYSTIFKQAAECRAFNDSGLSGLFGLYNSPLSDESLNLALKKYALDLRDESGLCNSLKSTNDCHKYRCIFPNGKYISIVAKKEEEFEYKECSTLEDLAKFKARYPNTKYNLAQKREDIVFNSCKTIDDYYDYLAIYNRYSSQAYQRIDDLKFTNCKSREDYIKYIEENPKGCHVLEAQHKIDDLDYNKCHEIADYEAYLKLHPNGSNVAKAKQRIEEEKLWQNCKKKDSWKLYKEYLQKYPNGRYTREATEKAVSPMEKFNKWRSNNGCLFTLIIIVAIAFIIAAITHGVFGIGCVFGFIALCGFGIAVGKGETGCGVRLGGLLVAAISGAIAYGLMTLGEQMEKESKASSALEDIENNPTTVSEYRSFFKKHYDDIDWDKKDEFAKQYYQASLDSCYATISSYSAGGYSSNSLSGLGYLTDFVNECYNPTYNDIAKKKYESLVDSLYNVAQTTNSYEGWQRFQNAVSADDYRDSEMMLDATDTRWATEAAAWQTATTNDDIVSYERYLKLYPNGKHKALADKKLIDAQVDQTFAGSHGALPTMDRTSSGGGSTTSISVYNNTAYTMTLLYSGIDSKRLVISPHQRGSLRLKNGSYRIAASVNASDVSNYAGSETLDGGSYEVEYYISTTSVPSRFH